MVSAHGCIVGRAVCSPRQMRGLLSGTECIVSGWSWEATLSSSGRGRAPQEARALFQQGTGSELPSAQITLRGNGNARLTAPRQAAAALGLSASRWAAAGRVCALFLETLHGRPAALSRSVEPLAWPHARPSAPPQAGPGSGCGSLAWRAWRSGLHSGLRASRSRATRHGVHATAGSDSSGRVLHAAAISSDTSGQCWRGASQRRARTRQGQPSPACRIGGTETGARQAGRVLFRFHSTASRSLRLCAGHTVARTDVWEKVGKDGGQHHRLRRSTDCMLEVCWKWPGATWRGCMWSC